MGSRSLQIILAIILALSLHINAAALDYEIPEEVQTACDKYGDEYGISPELLLAIIRFESCYVSDVSNGTCKGLMQINVPYHRDRMKRLGITDIYDIDSNIHVGADYIAELSAEYDDIGIVLGIYHGEVKAIENGENGKYSSYVNKILNYAGEIEAQKDENVEKNNDVCKNCAYAAVRTDLKRFAWCKYLCTCPEEIQSKHFAYRMDNDTCKSFLATNKPADD